MREAARKVGDFVKISLSGDLGSGKSTAGRILAERFSAEYYYTGKVQRDLAQEMGIPTYELNTYMEQHPEYDHYIDDNLKKQEFAEKNLIIDSRMAWHFVPSAFSVYLKVDLRVSAERILNANRDGEKYVSVEDAMEKIARRRASEKVRYQNLYGVDLTDLSNYDCILDTTHDTPEHTAEKIAEAYEAHRKKSAGN